MTVRISKFNNETKEQFMKSDKKILASESKITGIMADDIILLFNYEIKTYFGIGKVGMFENNVTFRENPIYNVQGVYDGAYSKYSKVKSIMVIESLPENNEGFSRIDSLDMTPSHPVCIKHLSISL